MLTFGENYFRALLEESRAECLRFDIPRKDEALQRIYECAEPFAQRDAAEKRIQELEREHAPPSEVAGAKKAYDEYKSAAQECLTDALMSLIPFLENDIRLDLEPRSLHVHLMKCAMISQQGADNMAAFCQIHGSRYAEELLLSKDDVMEDMLVNGGAKHGKYLEAYKLYCELLDLLEKDEESQFYDCHRRLAMATALELVAPISVFGTTDVFIDPKARFLHYVNAHKRGELDPTFPYFSAWEYRFIVDSDAENEELQWGRDQLLRYHPDMLRCRVPKFTYCKEVKTDVGYRTPDWGEGRRTYRKLLSGGGKYGPRAWMGRFLCKSFGVPTFGCRQPGHAAMVRYAPEKGWITCFGGGIEISWWENRDALDFQYEAHARLFEKDPMVYFQKVTLLECMSIAYCEPSVSRDCQFQGPNMLWNALVRAQRQYWARRANAAKEVYKRGPSHGEPQQPCAISTFLSRKDEPTDDNQVEVNKEGIRIPACAFNTKRNISCTRCFTGGAQVHFEPGQPGSIGYKLPADIPKQQYNLALKICTVHQAHEKEFIYVTVNGIEAGGIPLLYTVGAWLQTKSVKIDIGAGDELKLARKDGSSSTWGLSMRDLTLTNL